MMRTPFAVMVLVAGLAACTPIVPESGPAAGAGVQDYNSYIRNSAAQPYGSPSAGSGAPLNGALIGGGAGMPQASTGFSADAASAAIAAAEGGGGTAPYGATGAPLNSTGQIASGQTGFATSPSALPPIDSAACAGRGNAFAGIQETTAEMNYVQGGVSDEQDFSAVKNRETIASDAQRINCNRQQYVVVQPGALPVRPGDEGPNIAAFALATTNPPGVKLYGRPPFYLTNPQRACAKFASPDLAQQAFLASGGPQRDTKALDPDGDGFACSWDPRPFRIAKQ